MKSPICTIASDATFVMSGGAIFGNSANFGGGVYNEGTFDMTGGSIFGNVAEYTGHGSDAGMGGGVLNGGTFNMTAGRIYDNYSNREGGGVHNVIIAGLAGNGSGSNVFTLSGGEISDNDAALQGGGVYNGGTFNMLGGKVTDNGARLGGGVFNFGVFSLEGGTASHNEAEEGGGVWNANTLVMSGGAISDNTADALGGGVVNRGIFTLSGGTIANNEVLTGGSGGGIWSNIGVGFDISGGDISHNKADNGGGIYLDNNGAATISGANISGNTATSDGGGIWVDQTRLDKVNIAFDVVFSSNSARMPYDRKPADDSTYVSQIQGTSWTSPLAQGYNNYDIGYAGMTINRVVSITGGHSASPGADSYDFGTTVEIDAGDNPGFTFSGWTVDAGDVVLVDADSAKTSFTMPASDIALTANWEPIPIYTVTFDYGTHALFPIREVVGPLPEGSATPAAPQPAAQSGWRFTGWLPGLAPYVTADATYTAQWERMTHTVTFVGHDGVVLATEEVVEHADAMAPVPPVREGYTFTGWDTDFTDVTSDITVRALYEPLPVIPTYTVTFAPGEHGLFATYMNPGLSAGDVTPAAPQPVGESGWRFIGWMPAFARTVTGDVTYTAQWEEVVHAVTFVGHDGTILLVRTVSEGASATPPVPPAREGYVFTGWDRTFTGVTSDITVRALYEPLPTYTATFDPGTHGAFATQVTSGLYSGDPTPTSPQPVAEGGWRFIGWMPALTSHVTGNATYTAQWEPFPVPSATHTVTFTPGTHGTFTAQTTTGLYAGDVTPASPQSAAEGGWYFTGWLPALSPTVTDDATYVAQWERVVLPPDTPAPTPPPPAPGAPEVIIVNVPPATPSPDTYVTVTTPPASSTGTGQGGAGSTDTGTGPGVGGTDTQRQTSLTDIQTPLAGGDTDVADGSAGPNLLLLLSASLLLLVLAVGGGGGGSS
jgi:uncharacterized repeat protein (TIGR02543 family)